MEDIVYVEHACMTYHLTTSDTSQWSLGLEIVIMNPRLWVGSNTTFSFGWKAILFKDSHYVYLDLCDHFKKKKKKHLSPPKTMSYHAPFNKKMQEILQCSEAIPSTV